MTATKDLTPQVVMQSHYIIFDLRRTNLPETQCITQLELLFNSRGYVKKLFILRKITSWFPFHENRSKENLSKKVASSRIRLYDKHKKAEGDQL